MTKLEKIQYLQKVRVYLNFKKCCLDCGIAPNTMYLAFNGIDYAVSEKKIDELIAFIKNL